MSAENPYQTIKRSIADGIAAGEWAIGDMLPSEHDLTKQFQVSRMTVNRAMRELVSENLVRRVAGVGSYVAEPVVQSALVAIRNIAEEIAERGHVHQARLLRLGRVPASRPAAAQFGVRAGSVLYHSEILHLEDGVPLQLEDRLVSPRAAAGYLDQDFSKMTPNEFLTKVAPLQRVEHHVRAVLPTEGQSALLELGAGEACLLVLRKTWSRIGLVSIAELYHPGSRFALAGDFIPHPNG